MRRLTAPLALALPALLAPALSAQAPEALVQSARRAYAARRFPEAAEAYGRAFEADPGEPSHAYNAACSHALTGDREAALRWLDRAVGAGFAAAEDAARDEDFQGLHPDPRWEPLLARMRQRQALERTLWDSPALAPKREVLTEDERIAGLSRFWSEVKFNFIDTRRLGELDWDARYLEALPRVRAAASLADYYRELARLCAQLKDGHTNVYAPAAIRERLQARPLLRTRRVEGRVMVVAVYDEALKARGVLPGVEILTVDGRPVQAYAEAELAPFQSASTPQDLEMRVYTYAFLAGPVTEAPLVGFADAAGRRFEARVPRAEGAARRQAVAAEPPFAWRMLPGDVAYVALNSFGDDTAATRFLAAFPELRKARGLILDLRANGGGNSGVGHRILATLASAPFATSTWSTRDYRPAFRAWGRGLRTYRAPAGQVAPDPERHFAGPVVLLTSAGTYSAAEDFAMAFDALKRGTILGEPTGGSTGQPLFFELPGGGQARVCTKLDTYPDGRTFVGVGVQPHRLLRPTVADLRAGRDGVLEAALAALGGPAR